MLGRSVAVLVALTATAGATPSVPGLDHAPDKTRLLAGELNCTKCHASEDIEPKGAPSLEGVGARLQADWLRAFLTDPARAHPGTTMPDVLGKVEDREKAVEALVHYLATRREWKRPRLAKHAAAGTGEQLFKRIGCAACHDEASLAHVKAKYSFPALVDFLRRPLDHRPGGRMPDLKLTAGEAADIAAFLTNTADLAENDSRAPLKSFTVVAAEAVRGAELFRSVGCANCHSMEGMTPELESSPFGRPGECSVANYGLSAAQREALAKPIKPLVPKARVAHTMAALNCYACHARDGVGGPAATGREAAFSGDETLGNEGRFPPHLSGVGAKLKGDWIGKVLAGEGAVRPYLHTRMPVYGEGNIGHLPSLFAQVDRPEGERVTLAGNREGGRFLLGTYGGVGCISCHGVGGRKGLAMHSVSLDGATDRYHADWFRKHLIDPQATSPGTLMPSFWPGGEAGNKHVLGGDTERQIASIWTALRLGGGDLPPGFPDHDTGEFEIEVGAWPVVQRTMMPGAGTHAIAVGFPRGVHFVYDALNCRIAGVWRGRFLDGYNPWFSRKNPTGEPLGDEVKMLPAVPPHRDRHFLGYRLGEGRVPEFLYRDEHGEVTVRITPVGKGLLVSTTRGDKLPAKAVIIW